MLSSIRILSNHVQTLLRAPTLLPTLLRNARSALFPNNSPPPTRTVPSIEEQLAIRRKCAETIAGLIPPFVSAVYFSKEKKTSAVDEIEVILKVFGDTYMNKHLIFGVIELVVIRLLPEMAELGVEGLMAERLGEV
ncbi:hypothetical protein P152DRAFT_389610 [Eremomyces bilateralis CBS 781.70]|uniref:Uncharacterized protein n=1 Tax=Eremomyces bilateralis CBS 781.70 TaxID=1392243 RepID=A0A6G1GEB8_9PEZI|nr:uncharacterized protein P152DRAFT_389610 [Eremomyces bilateralis CBS 781.70]KAF1816455.1 hypothetical protein P152DRAFT_389610 [Eremomyces bilateralis CBS 781.70]